MTLLLLPCRQTGTLYSDGTKFDSSEKRDPLKFQLGAGRVIRGWDEGLVGMVKGEKRKLVIPHGLAYGERRLVYTFEPPIHIHGIGDRGYPPKIPPKSALVFEVELVDFV